MSKVATRTTTTTSRRARAPAAASTSSYSSRRAPPPPGYRVEEVVRNGVTTEVITIDDTPPPVAGSSGAGAGGGHASNGGRYESQSNYEPPPKKRRSDGAHISDQPYASSSSYRMPPPGKGHESSTQGGARNKRKLDAYDGYSNGRESGSGREARKEPKVAKEQPVHDKEGHFIVRVGDILDDRYRITRPLGQGTFGKVVCAVDLHSRGEEVAVKVIRAVQKYRDASKVEIKVLRKLAQEDPDNQYRCIHLIDTFDYKEHVCIVSELLSASVFDFLKENQYQPFPFNHIQDFARQLLGSVCFLHKHGLIHTDLKPENILLESTDSYIVPGKKTKTKKILKSSAIRLIDFGSATFEKEYHANVVSTRHYRAPEIILGMGWSYPCDVWSIGCILIEFYTGEALFQTHENIEHLAMMRRVFGEMPPSFADDASKEHPDWFTKLRPKVLDFPTTATTKQSNKFVSQMRPLRHMIPGDAIAAQRFLSLLETLLKWEPEKRATVEEALKHPFFGLNINEEPGLPSSR